jgi:hypothetical protein
MFNLKYLKIMFNFLIGAAVGAVAYSWWTKR